MCLLRALGRRSEPKSDSFDSVVFGILIIHVFRENASCCLVIGSEWYDLSSLVVGLLFVGLFLLLFFVGRYSFVFQMNNIKPAVIWMLGMFVVSG